VRKVYLLIAADCETHLPDGIHGVFATKEGALAEAKVWADSEDMLAVRPPDFAVAAYQRPGAYVDMEEWDKRAEFWLLVLQEEVRP
jgi:hypothetical protein